MDIFFVYLFVFFFGSNYFFGTYDIHTPICHQRQEELTKLFTTSKHIYVQSSESKNQRSRHRRRLYFFSISIYTIHTYMSYFSFWTAALPVLSPYMHEHVCVRVCACATVRSTFSAYLRHIHSKFKNKCVENTFENHISGYK